MKRIIICLILACSVLASNAKSWSIIGKALDKDTTLLIKDATNPILYRYVGKLTNKSFKVTDSTNYYIPTCGLSDPFNLQIGMEKQVDETQTGFMVKYPNSDNLYRISVTVGTTPQILVEKVVPYNHLYLIGGPVNSHDPNWLLTDAQELDKDPTNPFVFYYRGFLKYNTFGEERGSIKFLTSNTSWNPAFHPTGTVNALLSQASNMRLDGADTKWEIPADGSGNGYYVIKLNTLDETISVEQFVASNVNYPANVYITGDAMPCGWVNDVPEVMVSPNIFDGKYEWTGNVLAGQFKFLKVKGTWGSCYVSTVQDQSIEYGKSYPLVYEFEYYNNGGNDYKFVIPQADRCTIDVDLANMQMSVRKETQNSIENLKPGDEVIVTANAGKIQVKSSSSFRKDFAVFAVDGRKIHSNSFVYDSEVSLPKGCYIVKVTDNTGKGIIKKIVIQVN
ncbi:MAG: SusF/SusE family outer membrane protein [Bacteroidota bacterium]|nr:SusF/SusE family outer membrane protein [Bacteroidota bacterium]